MLFIVSYRLCECSYGLWVKLALAHFVNFLDPFFSMEFTVRELSNPYVKTHHFLQPSH
jgi:hypothetical protein